jgi:hypothetical protein
MTSSGKCHVDSVNENKVMLEEDTADSSGINWRGESQKCHRNTETPEHGQLLSITISTDV